MKDSVKRTEIIKIDQKGILLKLLDKVSLKEIERSKYKNKYYGTFEFYDKKMITPEQRRHYFALVGDISEFTGYPQDSVDAKLKYDFMLEKQLDEYPSVATNAMTTATASKLIEYVILFCIDNDIPFRKQQFYLTTDTNKMLYALTMKRLCMVCGKPNSDIHHATNLVGMGGNRKIHDHWNSTFMCLCREHHTEIHTRGTEAFCKDYYVKPLKLSKSDLKQLGVM